MRFLRCLPLLVAAILGARAPARAGLVCNAVIPATMLSTVTSASGYSGEVFRFTTTQAASFGGVTIAAGTLGYGIVRSAVPASNRARNGIVVLEPRFLLVGSRVVQITGDPLDASILSHGASIVGEGAGAIPIPGLGLAVKEALHGSNITVGPGYRFHVVPLGDITHQGPCRQTPATPSAQREPRAMRLHR